MTFDDNMLPPIDDPAVSLVRDERGLALVGEGMELRCDLAGMLPRIKPGRLSHELLVRAARVKGCLLYTSLASSCEPGARSIADMSAIL